MKTDNKFHRDGKGGYVGCFETTLDGKPAVVTFKTVKGLGYFTSGHWATTANVEGRDVINPEGYTYGLPAVIRSGATKRQATDVAFLAERGFKSHGKFARLPYRAPQHDYSVALVNGSDGSFEVIEQFTATDDAEANAYAKQRYPEDEWFVLDAQGQNINGNIEQ